MIPSIIQVDKKSAVFIIQLSQPYYP